MEKGPKEVRNIEKNLMKLVNLPVQALLEELNAKLLEQKAQVNSLFEKASGLKVMQRELQQDISSVRYH
jgi:hypothetical protein